VKLLLPVPAAWELATSSLCCGSSAGRSRRPSARSRRGRRRGAG